MPRKKLTPVDPFLTPVPDTCSLTETRCYAVRIGDDQRTVSFRGEIQISLSQKAVGVKLVEDIHESFRAQLFEDYSPAVEITNERKREYRQYFSGLRVVHDEPPILAEIEKKKGKGA